MKKKIDYLIQNDKRYTDVETKCCECSQTIIETILKEKLESHLSRIRCCWCLERHFRYQMQGQGAT